MWVAAFLLNFARVMTLSFAQSNFFISTYAGTGTANSTGNNGLASAATLNAPFQLWIDKSKKYLNFAETNSNVIRRIDLVTNIITLFAGTGIGTSTGDGLAATVATINAPRGIFGDLIGNVFISESTSHLVRIVNSTSGIIKRFAGTGINGFSGDNGAATSAQLNFPFYIAGDNSGSLFIADRNNWRIRKVVYSTGIITT